MTPHDALRRFAPFERLTDHDLEGLDGVRRITLEPGAILATEGERADAVYVIVQGEVAVIGEERGGDAPLLAVLGAGNIVGEIAVLTGGTRSATLQAVSEVEAVAIAGEDFETLLERSPDLGRELAVNASARLRTTRLAGQLQRLFPGADADTLAAFATEAEFVSLTAGMVLFHEGDEADAAYVVVSGRVRILVTTEDGDWREPIPEVGAGELIGELALLEDERRSATVVAARDTQLARFPRAGFEALVVARPDTLLAVTRTIVSRLRDSRATFRRARSDHATIGLVPITPSVDLELLGARLDSRLALAGRVARLTPRIVDDHLGIEGVAQAPPHGTNELRLLRWLEEAEEGHDLLVMQGDDSASTWTQRCIGRADHLVLVAAAQDEPRISEVEEQLLVAREMPHQRISLLLLHPEGTDRPRGTARWLEDRDVDDHLHLRLGNDGDLDRLGRYLLGRSVWLVMGGGGGKGFAHLGVARAMGELGIPIDGVAGTSVGALMAAAIADDTSTDELVDRLAPLFADLLDYTVPISGLIAARKVTGAIERFCAGRDVEDLWYPYRAVSANLTRSRQVIHRRGELSRALRATSSIPGVMPPVPYGDDLLVDGGVMNNLPVDVARRYNPTGVIVASDVAPRLGPRAKADHGLSVSGSRVLLQRLTPGVKPTPVPRIIPTLLRSMLLASAESRDRGVESGLADLHLAFELRGIALLDFASAAAVADRGYEESIDALTSFVNTARDRWVAVD